MEEPAKETNHEIEMMQEEERENDDCNPKQLPNTSFLSELNLLMVLFSAFSLLDDERLNYMESKDKNAKDHEAKVCISRMHSNRREVNEVKLMKPSAPRIHTTIRDSRYNLGCLSQRFYKFTSEYFTLCSKQSCNFLVIQYQDINYFLFLYVQAWQKNLTKNVYQEKNAGRQEKKEGKDLYLYCV